MGAGGGGQGEGEGKQRERGEGGEGGQGYSPKTHTLPPWFLSLYENILRLLRERILVPKHWQTFWHIKIT